MEIFPSNPPLNLSEEEWVLAVTSFEAKNSVFNITDENNSFSNTTPSPCISECTEEIVDEKNIYFEA